MGELPPPPVPGEVREESPLFGSARLKEFVLEAALEGEITVQDADDLFVEYGLRDA